METTVAYAPKILSGIDLIDQAWGGLYRGGSYLIYGRAVSGRGLLTMLFSQTGAHLDERCLFISPDRPKDLMIQAASMGFNLREAYERGMVKLTRIPQMLNVSELGDEGVAKALLDLVAVVRQHRPDRLIINDFMPYVQFRSFERFRSAFVQMLEQIDSLDTTMMLVMAEPANQQSRQVIEFMRSQMTGSIHIELVEDDIGSTQRRLTMIPNIGHIRRRVVEYWDIASVIQEQDEPAGPRILPGAAAPLPGLRAETPLVPLHLQPRWRQDAPGTDEEPPSQTAPPVPSPRPIRLGRPSPAAPVSTPEPTPEPKTASAAEPSHEPYEHETPAPPAQAPVSFAAAAPLARQRTDKHETEHSSGAAPEARSYATRSFVAPARESAGLASAPARRQTGQATPEKDSSNPPERQAPEQQALPIPEPPTPPAEPDSQRPDSIVPEPAAPQSAASKPVARPETPFAPPSRKEPAPIPRAAPPPTRRSPVVEQRHARAEMPAWAQPARVPPPEKISQSDRDAFRARLQQHFLRRDVNETPFLLVAMRMDRSEGRTARPFDFEFILDLVTESLRPQDDLLVDLERERLTVLLADSRPEQAQQFFARLKHRLREETPQQADHLLHSVSAIVVPDGRPFQNAEEFLTYALDET